MAGHFAPTRHEHKSHRHAKATSQQRKVKIKASGQRPRPRPRQRQPFRFFDLSAEMRNSVYEYFFADSKTEVVSLSRGSLVTHKAVNTIRHTGLPALLLACKQVRTESIGIFYARTKIVASETQHLRLWLGRLDREYRASIGCVHLDFVPQDLYDLSQKRLQLLNDRTRGYLKAILRQEELQMPACDVKVRIVTQPGGLVLWPKEYMETAG